MDITNRFEDRDSFIHWFIIASLKGIDITGEVSGHPIVVTMQINGVEVNVANSIDRLEEQFDRMVNDKACGMIDDLKYKITEKIAFGLDSLVEEVKEDAGDNER